MLYILTTGLVYSCVAHEPYWYFKNYNRLSVLDPLKVRINQSKRIFVFTLKAMFLAASDVVIYL